MKRKIRSIRVKKPGDAKYGQLELKVSPAGELVTIDGHSPRFPDLIGLEVAVIAKPELIRRRIILI